MPLANMNAMHMSSNRNYEVQRSHNFELILSGVAGSDILALALESFPGAKQSTPAIELAYQNSKVKVAGQAQLEDFEMVVKDFIGADTERIVNDWHRAVYNPETGQTGFTADYKKNGTLYEYSPDGSVSRSWKIVGCWPNNVDYGSFDYNNSDKKTIELPLSVDQAYRE